MQKLYEPVLPLHESADGRSLVCPVMAQFLADNRYRSTADQLAMIARSAAVTTAMGNSLLMPVRTKSGLRPWIPRVQRGAAVMRSISVKPSPRQ